MKTKRTTIRDIAEAAGVSISLVSFVMNNKGKRYRISDEMTKRIREMADKLDYQPNNAARSLRSGRSLTIGVVVSDISNSFFAEICRKIEDDASRFNYTVIFGSSDENADKFRNVVEVLLGKGVDGLILVPCEGSEAYIEEIYPAIPDTGVLMNLIEATKDLGYAYHVGRGRSHDSFYTDREDEIDHYWSGKGILGADIETAALFIIGGLRGVKTASILNTVSLYEGNLEEEINNYVDADNAAAVGEEHEIIAALETIVRMDKKN